MTFVILGVVLIGSVLKEQTNLFFPALLGIMSLFILFGLPLRPNLERKNEDYRSLTSIRTISKLSDVPLYTDVELNPIQIWEAGRQIMRLTPEAAMPSSGGALISFTKPNAPVEPDKVWEFRYDPDNKEKVIYIVLL